MKVCIALDHRKRDISNTGKGFFAQRLIEAMKSKGIEFVSPEQDADIDLGIGRWQYEPRAKKKILRLGAAHIDSSSDYKKHNQRKLESLKIANGVIYQSQFSKKVCDRFIGKTDKSYDMIPNGCNITESEVNIVNDFSCNFLASTRDWTPQKNLKSIIESFIDSGNKTSCLWIAGITHGIEKKFKSDRIRFLGLLSQDNLRYYYNTCDAMISIIYADACPNNVVEAICSGCWVLTSNSGGTQELIKEGKNGNILTLYKHPYDYKLVNLSKPIKINKEPLMVAFSKFYSRHRENDYLDINAISDRYVVFFRKILDA